MHDMHATLQAKASSHLPMPPPALPGAGMPQERLARIAARRRFVAMKCSFIEGLAELSGARGDWLRQQVRQALEPSDLWLLRGAVFSALKDSGHQHTRWQLHQMLDSAFPNSGGALSVPSR